MSFCASNATTDACTDLLPRRSITGLEIPATTCAFVTTSPRRTIYPTLLHAQSARDAVTRTTLSAAWSTPGSRAIALSGRNNRRRPYDDADRIDALERLEQALRRKLLVDPGEDRRLLHRPPQLGLPREIEEHRADRPADEESARTPSTAPAAESIERSPGTAPIPARRVPPRIPASVCSNTPPRIAAPSATRGAYGDPSLRNAGAICAPRYAPSANPASDSAPRTSPRESP